MVFYSTERCVYQGYLRGKHLLIRPFLNFIKLISKNFWLCSCCSELDDRIRREGGPTTRNVNIALRPVNIVKEAANVSNFRAMGEKRRIEREKGKKVGTSRGCAQFYRSSYRLKSALTSPNRLKSFTQLPQFQINILCPGAKIYPF